MEADESLLTGESEPVQKNAGDNLRSGSFIVAGSGIAKAIHVGNDNYAHKITEEARKYKRAHSEILSILNKIIRFISITICTCGACFVLPPSFFRKGVSWREAVISSSTGIIGMIPEGLVLLTSIAFAVGIVKLARRNTVVQELAGIEVLARVNTLCLDKTGTLTTGRMEVSQCIPLGQFSKEEISKGASAAVRAFEDKNFTGQALCEYFTQPPDWRVQRKIPFSSARKWSGVSFEGQGTFIIGAPEFILKHGFEDILHAAQDYAQEGCRVLLLAHSQNLLEDEKTA